MADVEIVFTGDAGDAQAAALQIDVALEQIERLADQVSRALGDIKIGAGQVAAFVSETAIMGQALDRLESKARNTRREVNELQRVGASSLLAAAVTGMPFLPNQPRFAGGPAGLAPGSPGSAFNSAGYAMSRIGPQPTDMGVTYGTGPDPRRTRFGIPDMPDPWTLRYGAGMGGRVSGPLESYSDRGRSGLLGMLLGAGGGRGGGGSEVLSALSGGGGGRGGGSIFTGGRGGGGGILRELSELVPGGHRSTGFSYAVGAGLGGAGLADLGPGLIAPLALLPSLAGAGTGALIALAAAMHGVGAAVAGDAKAFENLDPSAQKFTMTLRGMIPWVDQLQERVRGGLFKGLTAGIQSATTPGTVGAVNTAATAFGNATGGAFQQWGQYLGSGGFGQQFQQFSTRSAGDIKVWTDATIHLVDSLLRLSNAFAPLTEWMLKGIDAGSRMFDNWVKGKQASDGFAHSIETAKDSLRDIGVVLGAVGHLFAVLGPTLQPVGHELLMMVSGGLNGISDWIAAHESEIQNVLIGGLKAFGDVVKGVLGLLDLLLKALDVLLAPLDALVGHTNAMRIAFEAVIALQIAVAFSNMASAAAIGATNVGLFGKALLALRANPEIMAVLVALAAVAAIKDPGSFLPGSSDPAAGTSDVAMSKVDTRKMVGGRKPFSTKDGSNFYDLGSGQLLRVTGGVGHPYYMSGVTNVPGFASGYTPPAGVKTFTPAPNYGTSPSQGSATGRLQLPAGSDFTGTHHTEGFPAETGNSAIDIFAREGTKVLAPEDGEVTRLTGSAPHTSGSHNINGYSLYFVGYETGTTYFMTHLAVVSPKGSYKKGAVLGTIAGHTAGGSHVHLDKNAPISMAHAGSSASGTAPGFDANSKAWALPMNMQIALADAQGNYSVAQATARTGDDAGARGAYRTQVQKAISYLNANIGGLTGTDRLYAVQERASLRATLATLAGQGRSGVASKASRLGGLRAGGGVLDLIGTALGPMGGLVNDPADTLTATPLADAHAHWDTSLRVWRRQINELDKQLRDKTISADTVSTIRQRITAIKDNVTGALGDIKDAARQQAANFRTIWDQYIATFDQDFQQHTADVLANPQKYPGLLPLSAALADLTDAHTQQQLQERLKDAQDQLAKALAGTTDDSGVLQRARDKLGKDALAHALDVAQSIVLGGSPMDMTDRIIRDMQEALAAVAGAADPEAVKQAQRAVAEAEYDIKVDGLTRQAQAEQTAYANSQKELQKHVDATLGIWGKYFADAGKLAGDALALFNKVLIGLGLPAIADPNAPAPKTYTGTAVESMAALKIGRTGANVMMGDGGLVTSPHFLVDTKGIVRGMIGEGGTEMVVPVGSGSFSGRVRGGDGGSVQPVIVEVHTRDEALADFIDVRVVHPSNVNAINRVQGREANARVRAGRI